MIEPQTRTNGNQWSSEDPDPLWLLTPAELAALPRGTEVHSINGQIKVVGTDSIDMDTRYGVLAFGLRESQLDQNC